MHKTTPNRLYLDYFRCKFNKACQEEISQCSQEGVEGGKEFLQLQEGVLAGSSSSDKRGCGGWERFFLLLKLTHFKSGGSNQEQVM